MMKESYAPAEKHPRDIGVGALMPVRTESRVVECVDSQRQHPRARERSAAKVGR